MKIVDEISLSDFEAWCGAVETLDRILEEEKDDVLEYYIEDAYPNGITATQLNDLLRFNQEFVYRLCGIEQDDEDECNELIF